MSVNNTNGLYSEDIGLAILFKEEYGPIPKGPNLHSMSLYVFDVDKSLIWFEDMDIAVFKDDYRMSEGKPFKAKRIRKGINKPYGKVYRGRGVQDYKQLIEQKDVVEELELTFEEQDEDILVSLQPKSDFTLEHDCCYALYLIYKVEIGDPNKHLFFAGSVQPTDFKDLRAIMNLKDAKKTIWLWVGSKKTEKFSVWYFDGSKPCYYPKTEPIEYDEESGYYKVEKKIPIRITNWDRAKYFAVFAEI